MANTQESFCIKCMLNIKHTHGTLCNGCYQRKEDVIGKYCSFCKINIEIGVAG